MSFWAVWASLLSKSIRLSEAFPFFRQLLKTSLDSMRLLWYKSPGILNGSRLTAFRLLSQ
jgi:hypothetical protein